MIITNQSEPQRLKVLKKNGGYRGLIYTVTLNPAIDYIVRPRSCETGAVNRMASEDKFAGGKDQCQSCFEASRYREHSDWILSVVSPTFH